MSGTDGKGVASLVLGIIGIIVSFILLGGGISAFIIGIVAICLAVSSRRSTGGANAVAIVGLIFGIISLILGLRGVLCIMVVGAACSIL